MDSDSLWLCLHEPPICRYHEPAKCLPMLKINFTIFLPSTYRFSNWSFFRNVSVTSHSVNISCLQYRRHVMGIDHVTACLLVAEGGDGLQIRRLASKVLNKQSSTADSGCQTNLRVGQGAENFPPQRRNTIRSGFQTLGRFIQLLLS